MKVEEIAEAVAKLPPDQFARFRRWFTAFEAGRAFAELKKRAKEPSAKRYPSNVVTFIQTRTPITDNGFGRDYCVQAKSSE
jgi:hypothetical protein